MIAWRQWIADVADDKFFQAAAGVASILGFLITLWVWRLARRISERISANVRLPQIGRALEEDLSGLNQLHLIKAPMYEVAASLAKCGSRLKLMRRYRADLGKRRLLRSEIAFTRLLVLLGANGLALRLSRSLYGELMGVVLEIEEFSARIALRGGNG